MRRLITLAALAAFSVSSPLVASAADGGPAQVKKSQPRKAASSRQKLQDEAKGLALASETVESINDTQLEIASRVLVGRADCEFNQSVSIEPIEGRPGQFKVGFKNATYVMVPQETTTGAVRLEDKRAGIVWIQIPAKSMMMNSKIGQRVVDACTHASQRVALSASPVTQ